MKKSLLPFLILVFLPFSLLADSSAITAEYISLESAGAVGDSTLAGIDGYLKGLLVDSPAFDIRVGDTDVLIHGKLIAEGEHLRLNILVTDFADGRELRSASAFILSADAYDFAVRQAVLQLEGQEAAHSGAAFEWTYQGAADGFSPPDLSGSYVGEMATLLQRKLDGAEQMMSSGRYEQAVAEYRQFLRSFEDDISDDYQGALEDYFYEAEERLVIAEDCFALQKTQELLVQAEVLAQQGDFDGAYFLYERIFETVLDEAPGEKPEIDEAYLLVEELQDRMDLLCEEYLNARFDELEFQASYYGFRQDWDALEKAFNDFYDYAGFALYGQTIRRRYNRLAEQYEDRNLRLPLM